MAKLGEECPPPLPGCRFSPLGRLTRDGPCEIGEPFEAGSPKQALDGLAELLHRENALVLAMKPLLEGEHIFWT